jgi:hypothetical protein
MDCMGREMSVNPNHVIAKKVARFMPIPDPVLLLMKCSPGAVSQQH